MFLLLLGICLTLTVGAINTPFIPIEPDSTESTTKRPSTSETTKPVSAEDPTAPSSEDPAQEPGEQETTGEPSTSEPIELSTGESQAEPQKEPQASGGTSPVSGQESVETTGDAQKGCGGTISGSALLFLLVFAAAVFGRKKSF